MMRSAVLLCVLAITACGPNRGGDDDDPNAPCTPGRVRDCYTGEDGTLGVGPCKKGSSVCSDQKIWGQCTDQVVPVGENCTDGVDNNCNGMTDENVDADGDGFTTCAGDCCDSTECSDPVLVNEGAFDAPGNMLDDDCDGVVDNTQLICDQGLASNSSNATDYAKAMELCKQATPADRKWGVLSAKLSLADGNGNAVAKSHAIRPRFGTNVIARGGVSLVALSTGSAAGKGDTNPGYEDFQDGPLNGNNIDSAFPNDWFAANGNKLPNAPGCPNLTGGRANDPVMLTLEVRVPTNAKSFKLDVNFFSSEFPEFTCSEYNDFFVVLLDSAYTGTPANPTDKNLAFYSPMGSTMRYPVGVNLASGNTGLFTQCVNGTIGCAVPFSPMRTINTCMSTDQLANTGLDTGDFACNTPGGKQGGGTGWLVTSGNVKPGETIKLRIAIWDTSDHRLDSIAVIDAFTWSVDAANPGTVIF